MMLQSLFPPNRKMLAVFILPLFLFMGIIAPNSVHAQEAMAEDLVSEFHARLLDSMKTAETVPVQSRYDELAPIVKSTFHLRVMIQVATGSYWRKASDNEKSQLTDAFARLTAATYAAQFDGYSGQTFKTVGTKSGPQNTTLVETRLENPGGRSVDLVYVTRQFDGKWRVIDVLLDTGISELARKRSEYRQVLKSVGVEGLTDTLTKKSDSLLASS